MENQSSRPISPSAAQQQLRAARQAHDASVRRAAIPAGLILGLSVFSGAQTVAPEYRGPGNVLIIFAVLWFLAELVRVSARHQWRPLRALPSPNWSVIEAMLIGAAVLVGALIGPRVLSHHGHSALASWGLGAAVAVTVAACLFAANGSYRRRGSRAWPR